MSASDLAGEAKYWVLAATTTAKHLADALPGGQLPCGECGFINPHATETIFAGDRQGQVWPVKAGETHIIAAANANMIWVRTSASAISLPCVAII